MELSYLVLFLVPCVLSSPLEKNVIPGTVKAGINAADYMLTRNIIPSHYDLLIVPFFENFTIKGEVNITVRVNVSDDQITLNQLNLTVESASVWSTQGTNVMIYSHTSDDTQRLRLIMSGNLDVGETYLVNIKYSGILTDNMLGFYRSSYMENNVTKWLAITQFESTYARQAFPCFDEPSFRANFTIRVGRDPDYISLSNYPLEYTSGPMPDWNNKVIDTFKTTASMPTYLVAFSVNQFANLTNDTFRIFTRPEVKSEGNYLLTVGQDILTNIGNFLNISYPLPKIDVVAVPDFDAGAMENWGLTTYREKYVLYEEKINSVSDQQLLIDVVAHEFGHQWFGDLVTPEWWSVTWLNEAFATYIEYTIPSIMNPTWGMMEQFVYDNLQYALEYDVGSPRPMTAMVYTPTEINGIFDYVIYEKGGSILRMAEHFLTTNVWKAGLRSYLIANQYSTGTPESLFDHLDIAAFEASVLQEGIEVNNVLQTWTTQPGYPFLNVDTSSPAIKLTQKPFALDSQYNNLTWYVPISYTTQDKKNFSSTLPSDWLVPGVSVPQINSTSGWVIFNIQQTGFYRVNYDSGNWAKLTAQLISNHSEIHQINRAQLLDDSFKLARYGELEYDVPLGLTEYLANETDYLPWLSAGNNLRYLISHLYGTTLGSSLQIYARELLTNNFVALTSSRNDSEPHLTTLTRMRVVTWACDFEHPACESYANNTFHTWYNNQTGYVIPTDIKQSVFCTGLRLNSKNEDAFNAVWNYYLTSNNYADKLAVMYSLGCTQSQSSLNKYLGFLIDDSSNTIRRQDKWIVFRAVVSRQFGISTALKFLADNYNALIQQIGEKRVGSMISSLGNNIVQQAHIDQLNGYISNPSLPQTLRDSLNSVLSTVTKSKTWANTYSSAIAAWVSSNTDLPTASAGIVSPSIIINFSLAAVLYYYYKYCI